MGAPVQTRSERHKSADPEEFSPVTGREVAWRYTPLGLLEDFLTGELLGDSYDINQDNPEIVGVWRPKESMKLGQAGLPEDKLSALAWQNTEQVFYLDIIRNTQTPLIITRKSFLGIPQAAHTVLRVSSGVEAEVLVVNSGEANLVENWEILLDDNAKLNFVTCQDWNEEALHLASHFARLGSGSYLKHFNINLGGGLVRVNPSFHLAREGAQVESLGLYFAQSYQHVEHQVYVNHDAADTKSEINYRGVLSGNSARSVWVGDVLIGNPARNADSYEQNRNLILGRGARADSIPNLEIQNGNILGAGHASATMHFDDEHLFYLQSRGINEKEALRMVVHGFLMDIVQKAGLANLEELLTGMISDKLESMQMTSGAAEQ